MTTKSGWPWERWADRSDVAGKTGAAGASAAREVEPKEPPPKSMPPDRGAGTGLNDALALADRQAAADAKAAGVAAGIGLGKLGAQPKPPTALGAAQSPPPKNGAVAPKLAGESAVAKPGSESAAATPKTGPETGAGLPATLMGGIMENAARLQAKRAASSSDGPADKKQRAVAALVSLLSGSSGSGDGGDDLLDPGYNSLNPTPADSSDFLSAPETGSAEPLSLFSKRQPGKLFALGLRRIRDRLAALQGGGGTDSLTTQVTGRPLSFYHAVICRPKHPQIALHTSREMETLAEIVDNLCEGDFDRLGDVAMQRHQALEKACVDKSWELAQELEVADRGENHLASKEMVHRASRRRMQDVRLANALRNLQNRGRGDDTARGPGGAGSQSPGQLG